MTSRLQQKTRREGLWQKDKRRVWQKDKLPVLLTIYDTSHFSWETLPCVMVPTKYKKTNIANRQVWQKGKKTSIEYLRLTVGFCLSVRLPRPPPRPIEDIVVASVFLYSPSTALSQSAVAYVHVAPAADQSAIASSLHRYHCSACNK